MPEGSQALAGIGCHFMASWMDRETAALIQMGGEGVNWAASSLFTGGHVFQNLGDGTYYHSGYLAIRQAIAARRQHHLQDPVQRRGRDDRRPAGRRPDQRRRDRRQVGPRACSGSRSSRDDPDKFDCRRDFPTGVTIHPRERARRRAARAARDPRRHGADLRADLRRREAPPPQARADGGPGAAPFINELVCEGCGDCSVQSNCVSVEPLETPFGRKRKIDQSTCNKDYSCVKGFCPSFVTVEGATRRAKTGAGLRCGGARRDAARRPALPALDRPYDLLVTGVGGTGVVTVGALIAMAAHLEGKRRACSTSWASRRSAGRC